MGHGQTIAPHGIVKGMAFRVPFEVHLLHPTLVTPFDRPGWVYEEKVDGWRMVAYKSGENVHLVSRRGLDHTARFAALTKAIAALPSADLILDGEVAVFDERLVSRFDLLMEPDPDVVATPPVYVAFDVLHAHGDDLRAKPLAARRDILEGLVEGGEGVFAVRRLEGNGHQAWAEVQRRGLEGYVGKDPTSTYRPGGRTRLWLKSKARQEGEFLVGGVVERTEGWSLLVGSVSGDQLVYRGLVHFGVGRKLADALKANGLVRPASPFSEKITERGVTWLEPRLTASVTYTEILPQGRLRAGVFRGFVGSPSS